MTIVCIASYEKGHEFMREIARLGGKVILLTSASLKDKAQWPTEAISEIYYQPDVDKQWNPQHVLYGLAYLARTRKIDRIVALDDFDLELAASLREHFRLPGLGESETRYFRDKLAMRMGAQRAGIPVPRFCPIFNHAVVNEFLDTVPGPWLIKPRSSAGAMGIKKVGHKQEAWDVINALGDEQSYYVLEEFCPGDICHVDTILYQGEVRFAIGSQYGRPPLEVSHEGGIFITRLVEKGSELEAKLLDMNRRVLGALGLKHGASHTEFIVRHSNGEVLFLETSARVGGAHISDLIEAATSANPWREWARVEVASLQQGSYQVPELTNYYAGLLISLARQESPDLSVFGDPEVVWRMNKPHHVGIVVRSHDRARVDRLLADYTSVVREQFHASAPPRSRPTE